MWTKIRAVILVFLLAVAITPIGAESASANKFWEKLCKKPPQSKKDNPEYDLAIAKLCILHALDKLFSGALYRGSRTGSDNCRADSVCRANDQRRGDPGGRRTD